MELRKDPITQSWVIQENGDGAWPELDTCPLCPGKENYCPQTLYEYPYRNSSWQVRVVPHWRPLYRIEGGADKRGEGMYDRMRGLGAHEIVVDSPDHARQLSAQSDEHVAQVLRACVSRLTDLKKDPRFRYVTLLRNQGQAAGQELDHPHSQITAMPFLPRRVVYELRSSLRHFELKDRCLICDAVRQEMMQGTRTVEWDDQFLAFCPFASRVPYETWLLPVNHHHSFEEDLGTWERQLHFARVLKALLGRLERKVPAFHLVLHTAPNVNAKYEKAGHWQTLRDDFHWHFEIMPVYPHPSKSYSIKEVYYNSLPPETAAAELRKVTG
jgi:UDPglucose--hexose-1-phosphate uridylyltransferase